MSCEKCPHCIRLKRKQEKEAREPETHRTCKNCGIEKELNDFTILYNINSISRRWVCKKCVINRKKDYMKNYHLKHYVSKKKVLETPDAPQEEEKQNNI